VHAGTPRLRKQIEKMQVEDKLFMIFSVHNCLKTILSDRMVIAIDLKLNLYVSVLLNGHIGILLNSE